MWIRTDKPRIETPKKRYLLWLFVYLAFALTLIYGDFNGDSRYAREHYALPKEEAIRDIPNVMVYSLVAVALLYTMLWWIEKGSIKQQYRKCVCDTCNKEKQDANNEPCECGGTYVSIRYMKWVD